MTLCLPNNAYCQPRFTKKERNSEDITFAIIIFAFVALALTSIAFPAHAYDAYADIINNPRFEGNIREIQWIVDILDKGIVWIISLVGFFIISAAMLRNVLSGCYCAYPRLFDMLAETKEQFKGSKDQQGGMFKYILSFVIPNIKPLTDYADGTASPRGYFTKSLILGIITVIIGVCIYNGLYRDLISSGSALGTHVISDYVLKIDFIKEFDKLMETGKMYKFMWASSSTDGDKARQTAAKAVYLAVINARGDVRSTEARTQVGVAVESKMLDFFSNGAATKNGEEVTGDTTPVTSGEDGASSEATPEGGEAPADAPPDKKEGTGGKLGGSTGAPDDYLDSKAWKCSTEVTYMDSTTLTNWPPVTKIPEGQKFFYGAWMVSELDGGFGNTANDVSNKYVRIIMKFTQTDAADGEGGMNDAALGTRDDQSNVVIAFPTNYDVASGFTLQSGGKESFSGEGYMKSGGKVIKITAKGNNVSISGFYNVEGGQNAGNAGWSPPGAATGKITLTELVNGSWTYLKGSGSATGISYGTKVSMGTLKFVTSGDLKDNPKATVNGVAYGKPIPAKNASSSEGAASEDKAE